MARWYFWKSWHPQGKAAYWLLLLTFGLLIIYFTYSFFASPSTAIEWQKISRVDKVSVPAETIRIGLFDLNYTFDNYLVKESYQGSAVQLRSWPMVIQLVMVVLSLTVILVVCSAIKGFWFYFGALLFTGVLISFQWEQLLLFGESDKTGLITGLALFLSLMYFFNKIRPDYDLFIRFVAFGSLILLFGVFLYMTATVQHPLVYLVNYGLVAPLVLTAVFIIILGHVMISFFLRIITQTNAVGDKNSIWHFLIISIIYLANLFLLFGRNAGFLDWDILYLNAYLVLVVCAVLGIWDFKDREFQYQNLFAFAPLGGFLYLSLAIICFSTLSYIFVIANDPLIETFEDIVVYSQLSFGLLFIGYIIVNFIQPLMENMQVHRIMYKPRTFPYGTVQIVGLIGVVAFLANANFFPVYQAVAGYYNGIGDLHQLEEEDFVAEQYFKLGDQYGYNNHRSNYSLGALAQQKSDASLSPFYFGEAVKKRPSVYAHVNLGNALLERNKLFDALSSYEQGLKDFEANPYLFNNLAVAYGQTALLDSALYYLLRAGEAPETSQAAQANVLGLIASSEEMFKIDLDSLLHEVIQDKEYLPSLVNTFLLANKYADQSAFSDTGYSWLNRPDSLLNSNEFAYLFNYTFKSPNSLDSIQINQLNGYANSPANARYYEALSVVRAWALYQQNQVTEAVRVLDAFQALNPFQRGYYNNMLALWVLQQDAPELSSKFAEKAKQARFDGALLTHAVSLSEAAALKLVPDREAYQAWDTLYTLSEEGIQESNPLVETMRNIFGNQPFSLPNQSDESIYLYLTYRFSSIAPTRQLEVLKAIENPNHLSLALHDLWLKYPDQHENLKTYIETLMPLPQMNAASQSYVRWLRIFMLEDEQNWSQIISLLEGLEQPSRWHSQLIEYYQFCWLTEQAPSEEAKRIARRMIGNPFFEKGFLRAVHYLYKDPLEQYNLLLKAQRTNPNAPELKQAYVLASLKAGLEGYAEETLVNLQGLMSPSAYEKFLQDYNQLKSEITTVF